MRNVAANWGAFLFAAIVNFFLVPPTFAAVRDAAERVWTAPNLFVYFAQVGGIPAFVAGVTGTFGLRREKRDLSGYLAARPLRAATGRFL